MKNLQKYQAFAGDGEQRLYKEQIVVGDQLSVERGTNAQFQLANGFTPEQRFENMHFEAADFHAEMKFMQVLKYKQFYTTFVENITDSWPFHPLW